jgi:hypothetical protein
MSDIIVPEGFQYHYRAVFGGYENRITHLWCLVGDKGAIHISAFLKKYKEHENEWMGGIECHWSECPGGYFEEDNPHNENCWLTHKPCWSDGSSTWFNENIAPMLPAPWRSDNADEHIGSLEHERMLRICQDWYRNKIEHDYGYA